VERERKEGMRDEMALPRWLRHREHIVNGRAACAIFPGNGEVLLLSWKRTGCDLGDQKNPLVRAQNVESRRDLKYGGVSAASSTMASKHIILPLRSGAVRPVCKGASHKHARSMATQAFVPTTTISTPPPDQARHTSISAPSSVPAHLRASPALPTLYSFPSLQPLRFVEYPADYLNLPLRKDILHRAIVYEGDKTRQGTASTKWRSEIHGSNRKIRQQKGSGKARLGNKKSPMLRGGGAAFGPKPRDFTTSLNKKVYDLALRTALSYRWKRGELVVVSNNLEIPNNIPSGDEKYWLKHCFNTLGWGNEHGRSFLITNEPHPDKEHRLSRTLNEECGEHGRARSVYDVDVKNLLEMGRLVVAEGALKQLFQMYRSDLPRPPKKVEGMGNGLTMGATPGEIGELIEDMAGSEQELFEQELDEDLDAHVHSAVEANRSHPLT
jgi:large subunit ribosomal protein L4